MDWRGNRKLQSVVVIVAVLITFRFALPFLITLYVNNTLKELRGYSGSIKGVNVNLLRGSYEIDSLKIFKANGHREIPFIEAPFLELSVEWNSILKGGLVGEIKFENPALNFIACKTDNGQQVQQSGEQINWTALLKRLLPLKLNHITIKDGRINLYDFSTHPAVNVFLYNVQLEAQNLNNAKDNPDILPSRVFLQASSIGNGQLSLSMKIHALKKIPDLDLDLKFENVNMIALSDFFKAYTDVGIVKGNFNLYSEVAVMDDKINGYLKPQYINLKIGSERSNGLNSYRIQPAYLKKVSDGGGKGKFTEKVLLVGKASSISTSWPAMLNVLRKSFFEACERSTEETISVASADE